MSCRVGKDTAGWCSWCFERGLVPTDAAGAGCCRALLKALSCQTMIMGAGTLSSLPIPPPPARGIVPCSLPPAVPILVLPTWSLSHRGAGARTNGSPQLTLGPRVAMQDEPHCSIKPPSRRENPPDTPISSVMGKGLPLLTMKMTSATSGLYGHPLFILHTSPVEPGWTSSYEDGGTNPGRSCSSHCLMASRAAGKVSDPRIQPTAPEPRTAPLRASCTGAGTQEAAESSRGTPPNWRPHPTATPTMTL